MPRLLWIIKCNSLSFSFSLPFFLCDNIFATLGLIKVKKTCFRWLVSTVVSHHLILLECRESETNHCGLRQQQTQWQHRVIREGHYCLKENVMKKMPADDDSSHCSSQNQKQEGTFITMFITHFLPCKLFLSLVLSAPLTLSVLPSSCSQKWRMKIQSMCSNSKPEVIFCKDCFLQTSLPPPFYPTTCPVFRCSV